MNDELHAFLLSIFFVVSACCIHYFFIVADTNIPAFIFSLLSLFQIFIVFVKRYFAANQQL